MGKKKAEAKRIDFADEEEEEEEVAEEEEEEEAEGLPPMPKSKPKKKERNILQERLDIIQAGVHRIALHLEAFRKDANI